MVTFFFVNPHQHFEFCVCNITLSPQFNMLEESVNKVMWYYSILTFGRISFFSTYGQVNSTCSTVYFLNGQGKYCCCYVSEQYMPNIFQDRFSPVFCSTQVSVCAYSNYLSKTNTMWQS